MSGLDDTSFTTRSVTASTTVTDQDYFILVSPAANVVITIPAATAVQPGRVYTVRRDATATNTVTITPSSTTINGTTTFAVGSAGAIGTASVISTGSVWLSF